MPAPSFVVSGSATNIWRWNAIIVFWLIALPGLWLLPFVFVAGSLLLTVPWQQGGHEQTDYHPQKQEEHHAAKSVIRFHLLPLAL